MISQEGEHVPLSRAVAPHDASGAVERWLLELEEEIQAIPGMQNIGAVSLNTSNIKLQLTSECRAWKVQYSNKLHQQARENMYALLDYMRVTNNKLSIECANCFYVARFQFMTSRH